VCFRPSPTQVINKLLWSTAVLDHGPWLLRTIHTFCHIQWMYCNSVMIPSGHMTCIAPVHPGEGSSSVALLKVSSLFSLRKFLLIGSFSWSDVRTKVRDVVCVRFVKPAEANLQFVILGCMKMKWIEFYCLDWFHWLPKMYVFGSNK